MTTPKQRDLIAKLITQIHGDKAPEVLAGMDLDTMDGRSASREISGLIRQANAPAVKTFGNSLPVGPGNGLTPGVYRVDDIIVRVYPARGSGHLVASKYADDEWVYLGAAGRFVRPEHRLGLDETRAFGRETGVCAVCGRMLTNAESIEAGIGPVCLSKV